MAVTNFQLAGDGETIKEIGAQPPLANEQVEIIDDSPLFREVPALGPFLERRTPAGGDPYMVLDLEKLEAKIEEETGLEINPEAIALNMCIALRAAGQETEMDPTVRSVDQRELMFGAQAWTTDKLS